MVAEILTGQRPSREFTDLLRPEPLPDGTDPEERLIFCGLSWQQPALFFSRANCLVPLPVDGYFSHTP